MNRIYILLIVLFYSGICSGQKESFRNNSKMIISIFINQKDDLLPALVRKKAFNNTSVYEIVEDINNLEKNWNLAIVGLIEEDLEETIIARCFFKNKRKIIYCLDIYFDKIDNYKKAKRIEIKNISEINNSPNKNKINSPPPPPKD